MFRRRDVPPARCSAGATFRRRDALMEAAAKESNGALVDVPEDPKPRVKDES